MKLLPSLLITLQLLLNLPSYAQNRKLLAEKEPDWVTVNTINYNITPLESEAEDGYLDLSYEKQVSLQQQSKYIKRTLKTLSEAGVQNSSEISVNFDPSYEHLAFHTIRILRNGQWINKLQLSKFKVIQQEKDLSRHMYDGSYTALLMLDDVRKGDIIEYSYTLKGFNPIFNGRYSDFYELNFSVPMVNVYYKLIAPTSRNVVIKNLLSNVSPLTRKTTTETTYEWKETNVAPLHSEAKTPGWYDPYSWIMVSEYSSWGEVSKWAAGLFPRNLELSTQLRDRINNIETTNATNEARVLAALRFVQDEVRYMGIEMGVNSHKPSHPNKIFAQRFGDCKDKSYLLSTMLNAMGIEASPILINTVAKKTINNWLPSASAFDHATVQVKLNEKLYYFDPTISFQRGAINDISYPDYQTGLVVDETTNNLTSIPFHNAGMVDIKEIFTILDMSGKAQLKVVTKNTGAFADDSRDYYNNNSIGEIKSKYKDFYASYFDKITPDSLTYKNDDVTGAFTTTEYYTLSKIWTTEDGIQKFPFTSYVINSVRNKPSDQSRTMPFYLTYPAHYKEQLEINMPEDWSFNDISQKVESPAFKFSASGYCSGKQVIINYEYENLKDNVEAGEATVFFANYKRANEATDYDLTYKANNEPVSIYEYAGASSTTSSVFTKLYTLLALAVVITFFVRRQKQKEY